MRAKKCKVGWFWHVSKRGIEYCSTYNLKQKTIIIAIRCTVIVNSLKTATGWKL